jgi:tetratricopeptide (TPR) repeat protein
MTGLEGPALSAAAKAAIALAREWTRSRDFDRLCDALARRFEDRGGFSSAFFQDLAEDEAFLWTFSSYFSPPHLFDRGALIAALTPLVGPLDADSSAEDFAVEIADAIREEMRTAKTGDELVRFEVDRVIEAVGMPVVEPALGWAPERARAQLERSARKDPQGIGRLAEALAGKDQRTEIVGLVRHPQPWLATGGPPLWESIAILCKILGCHEEARSAWGTYEGLPGADRVRGLFGAAAAAGLRGDAETEATLLSRARELYPGHDRVRLAAAARIEDPAGRRQALEGLAFEQAETEADRLAELALTLDDLGLIEEARPVAAKALDKAPARLGPREAVAATVLADHIRRFETGRGPDRAALRIAAGHYGYLRKALRESGRRHEAGGVAGRLIQCEMLADRHEEARRLLVAVDDEELRGEVPVELAGLALALGQFEQIDTFLGHYEGGSPRADLLRARLALRDPARRVRAVADLDELLGGEEAFEAAVIRLSAAVPSTGEVPWSEAAERVVATEQPVLASHLKAEWHSARGDGDAARRELARHVGDPRAESWLMMYLVDRKEWAKAAPHAEALLRADPDHADRIAAGQVLRHAGRQAAAEAAFRAVAEDPEASAREFETPSRSSATC